jgi:hypothetical protein
VSASVWIGAEVTTDSLPKGYFWLAMAITVIMIFGIGFFVYWSRMRMQEKAEGSSSEGDRTLIRSWLSAVLVSGLVLLAVTSLFLAETQLRSLLMGGVIASAGTATAFYFAAKASEQTQRNLLDAAFSSQHTVLVPDLAGRTVDDARMIVKAMGLQAEIEPPAVPGTALVATTRPEKGTALKADTKLIVVVVTVPNVVGKTVKDAKKILEEARFKVVTAGAKDTDVVTGTDPAADAPSTIGADVALRV